MMPSISENWIKTDVLVIGGGLAGCFAAMKAVVHGVKVTLLEKAHVTHSGSNAGGIDHFPYCYIPEIHGRLGYKIEDFVADHMANGQGAVDQDLCEMMWRDSYDRLLDLEKIGVKVRFEKIYPWNFGVEPGDYPGNAQFRLVPWTGFRVPPAVNIEGRFIKEKMNDAVRKLGVNILNYHDTVELLTRDGEVLGAAGFNIRTADFFVAEAKATVLATGSLTRLFPRENWGNSLNPPNQTAEGQTMALRAGAELAVMEQIISGGPRVRLGGAALKNWSRSEPATPSGYPAGRVVNVAGEVMPNKVKSFDQTFEPELGKAQLEWFQRSLKEGKVPFYWDATMASEEERKYAEWSSGEEGGGAAFFLHLKEEMKADLATHQIELETPRGEGGTGHAMALLLTSPSGVVINTRAETTLRSLYAGGEVAYGQHFPASPWACVTGARAGHSAAERASKAFPAQVDEKQVKAIKERLYAPLGLKEGYSWDEINREISNIMVSYFRSTSHSLKTGLKYLDALKKEKYQAANPHELMRLMETFSLLTVAEIFFRAVSFSRQPDEWRILSQVDGEMNFSTRPIRYKYPLELRR